MSKTEGGNSRRKFDAEFRREAVRLIYLVPEESASPIFEGRYIVSESN